MRMSIDLAGFPMSRFEDFKEQVNRYAKVNLMVGGEDTVFLSCDADMIKCQQVIIIADLYMEGGDKNEKAGKT